MSNFVPLEEAAKKLGVSTEELVEMRSRGEIFGYRDGGSWKFKPEEIERVGSELMGDALDEDPAGSSILVSDSDLYEPTLDIRSLIITFSEEEFINYAGLIPSHFTLVRAPAGLTIQSVNGISPIQAHIELQFLGTDFDADSNNFAVDINASVLIQTTSYRPGP